MENGREISQDAMISSKDVEDPKKENTELSKAKSKAPMIAKAALALSGMLGAWIGGHETGINRGMQIRSAETSVSSAMKDLGAQEPPKLVPDETPQQHQPSESMGSPEAAKEIYIAPRITHKEIKEINGEAVLDITAEVSDRTYTFETKIGIPYKDIDGPLQEELTSLKNPDAQPGEESDTPMNAIFVQGKDGKYSVLFLTESSTALESMLLEYNAQDEVINQDEQDYKPDMKA